MSISSRVTTVGTLLPVSIILIWISSLVEHTLFNIEEERTYNPVVPLSFSSMRFIIEVNV